MRRFWGIVYLGLVVADVVPPILVGTAWNALQLGVSIIAIGKWRTERGIWMLASLFAAIDAWLLAMFTRGIGRDLLRGTAYPPLIALDSALSLALLATTAFLLVCVARWNWRLTRPPRLPPSWPDAGSRVRGPVRPNQPPLAAAARAPAG